MEHANLYDVRSSQSKGFTPGELKRYKTNLLLVLAIAHDPFHIHMLIVEEYRKLIADLAKAKQASQKKTKQTRKRRE